MKALSVPTLLSIHLSLAAVCLFPQPTSRKLNSTRGSHNCLRWHVLHCASIIFHTHPWIDSRCLFFFQLHLAIIGALNEGAVLMRVPIIGNHNLSDRRQLLGTLANPQQTLNYWNETERKAVNTKAGWFQNLHCSQHARCNSMQFHAIPCNSRVAASLVLVPCLSISILYHYNSCQFLSPNSWAAIDIKTSSAVKLIAHVVYNRNDFFRCLHGQCARNKVVLHVDDNECLIWTQGGPNVDSWWLVLPMGFHSFSLASCSLYYPVLVCLGPIRNYSVHQFGKKSAPS